METYEETVGWADMILEVIEDKRMPPWHADSSVGTFANSRSMSQQDIAILKIGSIKARPKEIPAICLSLQSDRRLASP